MAYIETKNISKSFRIGLFKKRQVLKGVNFHAGQGEFICLIGRSGSGKTTFLKILAGIIKPNDGEIRFQDKKLGLFKGFYRRQLGFVFQDYKLIPHLNVFENVSLPLRIRNIPGWKKKALESLEFTGIAHLAKQYPYQLSGGESQRASISRTISINPNIIFADEPTGNLDTETEKEILAVFQKINRELNKTFIIITHEQDILDMASRTYQMKEGILSEI